MNAEEAKVVVQAVLRKHVDEMKTCPQIRVHRIRDTVLGMLLMCRVLEVLSLEEVAVWNEELKHLMFRVT